MMHFFEEYDRRHFDFFYSRGLHINYIGFDYHLQYFIGSMTNSVLSWKKMWQDFCGNSPISTSSVMEIMPQEGDYPKAVDLNRQLKECRVQYEADIFEFDDSLQVCCPSCGQRSEKRHARGKQSQIYHDDGDGRRIWLALRDLIF